MSPGRDRFCVLFLLVISVYQCFPQPPNIVFIVADDLGWNDVGWRNPQMVTPNLDKLARAGVILNSSYVQPVCTPSRSCFMSGYYPYRTGLQSSVILPSQPNYLPSHLTLLPEKLRQLKYSTHIVGKWHLGFCNWKYTPTFRGFDSFFGYYTGSKHHYTHMRSEDGIGKGFDFRFNTSVHEDAKGQYSAFVFANRAIEIITSHSRSKPLYLYLSFQQPHGPLQVPLRFQRLCKQGSSLARRKYCGMVSALDEAVGNITKALQDTGLMDNLFLVFTTDNGGATHLAANNLPLRGAKGTLWEGGTKGTAFVYSKTLLKKTGYTNTGLIHAVDWYPTLLTMAGGKADPAMDGIDQTNTLISGAASKRESFVYNIDDVQNNAAIRVGDLKLIEGKPGIMNGWYPIHQHGVSPFTYDREYEEFPHYQLFNITADPAEIVDLSQKYPEIVEQMKLKLDILRKSMVPSRNPARDPASNPMYYNGTWSPGWC